MTPTLARAVSPAARGALGGVLLLLAALVGCSAPTLDADDLEGSARRVRDSVDEEQRVAFDEALELLRRASRGEVQGTEKLSLDGLNAEAILAEAERVGVRRDIAWFEELRRYHQEILDVTGRLARFEVVDATPSGRGDQRVRLTVSVRNGLDEPIGAGWMRTEVRRGDGRTATSLDYVVFRPPAGAGATARSQVVVSGDAARFLPEAVDEQVTFRFSSLERGGRVVLEAPTPEMEGKARAGVEEARARIAELRERLGAGG